MTISSTNPVDIETFVALEIRVGEVTHAIPVPESKKLIKLTVFFGETYGTRTILTGLLPFYPDMRTFIGKKYLFLTNLVPRVMAGIQSQGMFLALESGDIQTAPTLVEVPYARVGSLVR